MSSPRLSNGARLFGVVLFGVAWLFALGVYARAITEDGVGGSLFIPSNLDDAKRLHVMLARLLADRFSATVILFAATYLWKQSFAVPGSAVLNVLAGALFGCWRGLLFTTVLTACGASICFLMSRGVGVDAITSAFPAFRNKLESLRMLVDAEKKSGTLFLWLVSARLFPFTPNWLLNMAYPHIGISCRLHFVTILSLIHI